MLKSLNILLYTKLFMKDTVKTWNLIFSEIYYILCHGQLKPATTDNRFYLLRCQEKGVLARNESVRPSEFRKKVCKYKFNWIDWIDYSELVRANTINSRVKNIWLVLVSGRVSYKNRTIRYYWKFSNKTCLNAFTTVSHKRILAFGSFLKFHFFLLSLMRVINSVLMAS